MSFPNIPDISPSINLNRDDVINLLLASIGLEELGLAHILNAEGEKIQCVTENGCSSTIQTILDTNDSVDKTLRSVIMTQILLQFKLEDILDLLPTINIFSNTATVEGFYNETEYTSTDKAYYHTRSHLRCKKMFKYVRRWNNGYKF